MFTSTTMSEYSNSIGIRPLLMESATTKWKHTNIELAPNCPRCASSNTKFCYYNNYSLSQPRYFCKGCRRYWTKGGSLRNVPVGGGCRKSRRARAARQGGGGGKYAGPTLGQSCGLGPADESNGGACIDMAAVFAKYVNQNVENEESSSPGASTGSSDNFQASNSWEIESQLEDITMFEYQKQLDLVSGGDDQIQHGIPEFSTCQDVSAGQDFVYQDSNAFELEQGVLGDELGAADILWSDSTNLPNFGSQLQPMMQVQDFGLFSPDDQLRISSNLVTDNWGSFDLSSYEFYSTP